MTRVILLLIVGACNDQTGGDTDAEDRDDGGTNPLAATIDTTIVGIHISFDAALFRHTHEVEVGGDTPTRVEIWFVVTEGTPPPLDEVHPLDFVSGEMWSVTLEPLGDPSEPYAPGSTSQFDIDALSMSTRVAIARDAAGTLADCLAIDGDAAGLIAGDHDDITTDEWDDLGLSPLNCSAVPPPASSP